MTAKQQKQLRHPGPDPAALPSGMWIADRVCNDNREPVHLAMLQLAVSDGPEQWLVAGQALQRVLLVACRLGLLASFLNQPVQVAALRFKLQHLLGRPGFAQVLLRLGCAENQLPASARRPLADVVEHA